MERNFDRAEFACKGRNCCGHSAPIGRELVAGLQELQDLLSGDEGRGVAIFVTSGFRCVTHDRKEAVKRGATVSEAAARESEHCVGLAADVVAPLVGAERLARMAESVGVFRRGGIGRYTGSRRDVVHLDVRSSGPARWTD